MSSRHERLGCYSPEKRDEPQIREPMSGDYYNTMKRPLTAPLSKRTGYSERLLRSCIDHRSGWPSLFIWHRYYEMLSRYSEMCGRLWGVRLFCFIPSNRHKIETKSLPVGLTNGEMGFQFHSLATDSDAARCEWVLRFL